MQKFQRTYFINNATLMILKTELQDTNKKDRKWVLRGLTAIGDEKSIDLIKKAEHDPDESMRKEATKILEKMSIKTEENINE